TLSRSALGNSRACTIHLRHADWNRFRPVSGGGRQCNRTPARPAIRLPTRSHHQRRRILLPRLNPPGGYQLTVSVAGFETYTQTGIAILGGDKINMNVVMKVGNTQNT